MNLIISPPIIPEATTDLVKCLRAMGYPKGNLLEEIVSDRNLSESFDYVISHLENKHEREAFRPRKSKIINRLKGELLSGKFRITQDDIREIEVKDGAKLRICQAPRVYHRIGCHTIMVVVERVINPTLISNTAASIKGRGMHWLFHRMEQMIDALGWHDVYYYQSDYRHYYESISQERMMAELRLYISDETVLAMLDNFITLLPEGLSKGLRSSQCLGNLFVSPIDHAMNVVVGSVEVVEMIRDAEVKDIRYLYCRYMDDIVILAKSKKDLWHARNRLHELSKERGLEIKPSEAVRPLSEGLNYLGFVNHGSHALLRKRTKQTAARKLARIKSRKRRQSVIGSFKGMACHGDCKHLYKILTNDSMKKFNELGVKYIPADGKKRFEGRITSLGSILNTPIEVYDFERDVNTRHGADRYVVSCKRAGSDEWLKFFTASEEMKNLLEQIAEQPDGFPFETIIKVVYFDNGKRMYM